MNYEREYTKAALDAVEPYLFLLPSDVQRAVKLAKSVHETNGFPTCEELRQELGGTNWVLARRTKAIVDRYGEDVICVSPAQYEKAERTALEKRF